MNTFVIFSDDGYVIADKCSLSKGSPVFVDFTKDRQKASLFESGMSIPSLRSFGLKPIFACKDNDKNIIVLEDKK